MEVLLSFLVSGLIGFFLIGACLCFVEWRQMVRKCRMLDDQMTRLGILSRDGDLFGFTIYTVGGESFRVYVVAKDKEHAMFYASTLGSLDEPLDTSVRSDVVH